MSLIENKDMMMQCAERAAEKQGDRAPIDLVQDPFANISVEELTSAAAEFAREHGLAEHAAEFTKGALLCKGPPQPEYFLREELQVLDDELNRKWHLPRGLWLTVIVCSVGAAVQGWDQTGSNGANLSFPKVFGIGSNSGHDRLLVGFINAAPVISMTLIGCWLSEPINNLVGRRGAIFVSAIFSLCSVIGSAFTQTWPQLLACRILLGIGLGIKSSTTAVFTSESAPARIRGTLVMTWQLWVAFGIFLGFCANIAVLDVGKITWRLQLGSAFIPAVPLAILVYFCPESPRWYIKKGRFNDAFKSLCRLRHSPLLAARDLFLMQAQVAAEKSLLQSSGSGFVRFVQLFTVPRLRRANLAASTVMIAKQMCGINIIAFYSSSVFVEAGISVRRAPWASWGFGLINFLFAIPALKTIDTYGRRSLLLATFPHMAWSLLATGLCYLRPGDGTGRLAALALFIFLFAIFYSPGEGPVCFVYGAEVFPLSHREIGMAFAVAVNAGGAAVLALTFTYMLKKLTPTGAFGFYCGLNVLAFMMIFCFVPETRQYSLEELDAVFSIRTRDFMRYQFRVAAPWWIKRWIFWRRGARLESIGDYLKHRE